jgi:hypothetical protein
MIGNEEHPMTDEELIVQRFLDQELSAEERVRLLVEIGRNTALRERLLSMEELLLDVSTLPRPEVRHDFVARVMAHIEVPAPTIWRRIADAAWAPHQLRWNLVGAAAAVLLLLVAAGTIARVGRPDLVAGGPGDAAITQVSASGAEPTTVLVRLVLVQPGASTVEAAGDFNGWNPSRTPLEPVAGGAWAVTVPLEPGRYEYMFVVDGTQWVADPFAAEQIDDGFGSRNAVLDVGLPSGASL